MRHPASGYRRKTSHGVGHKGDGLKASGYPNVCAAGAECLYGQKIIFTGSLALWFDTGPDGVPRSWHFDCAPREASS